MKWFQSKSVYFLLTMTKYLTKATQEIKVLVWLVLPRTVISSQRRAWRLEGDLVKSSHQTGNREVGQEAKLAPTLPTVPHSQPSTSSSWDSFLKATELCKQCQQLGAKHEGRFTSAA